jgi:hypothetical protein
VLAPHLARADRDAGYPEGFGAAWLGAITDALLDVGVEPVLEVIDAV